MLHGSTRHSDNVLSALGSLNAADTSLLISGALGSGSNPPAFAALSARGAALWKSFLQTPSASTI